MNPINNHNNAENSSPKNEGGVIDNTRQYIHNAVRTEKRQQAEMKAERPVIIQAKDLVLSLGQITNEKAAQIKDKYNMDDDGRSKQEEKKEDGNSSFNKDIFLDPIENVRETIYDLTKSQSEIDAEKEAQKGIIEKAGELPKKLAEPGQNEDKDAVAATAAV